MIEYRDSHDVDLEALRVLRAACAFADKDHAFLAQQVTGARWLVHAYDGDRLVGFCRAISDGVSSAYVSSVMVDPAYRRRGIGRELLDRLVAGRDDIKFVLHTRKEAAAFYAAVGFAPATDMMIRDRRR
ncbi:MAG: GNAT family N-acetyltransferase [Kofleriaceae bacterium]|nr:GNAT family N-acetyltransferase [Kofleriaceae bacterium]